MVIGYSLASKEKSPTGINRYSQEILKNLLCHDEISMEILGENFLLPGKISERYGLYANMYADIKRQKELWVATVMDGLDIIHSFYHPIFERAGVVKILTIYDLSPLVQPEWFSSEETFMYFDNEIRTGAKDVDAIVTISQSSKNEIVSYYGIQEEKVRIIYPGANCMPIYGREYNNIKEKFGIKGDYLLSIGTLQPRKNIKTLIKAYCMYKERHTDSDIKLVLTGRRGWKYDEIFEEAGSGKYVKDIIFTGYVSDEDLSMLYSSATAFAYISYYEGFGIPILEALAHKKAVLSSNTTSMPEVGGDAAIYCDPYDLESVYDGLCNLLENESLRKELEGKAEKQAAKFSYETAAEQTYQLYKELV